MSGEEAGYLGEVEEEFEKSDALLSEIPTAQDTRNFRDGFCSLQQLAMTLHYADWLFGLARS